MCSCVGNLVLLWDSYFSASMNPHLLDQGLVLRETGAASVAPQSGESLPLFSESVFAIVSGRGIVTAVSPEFGKLFGSPVRSIVGESVFDLLQPGHAMLIRPAVARAMLGASSTVKIGALAEFGPPFEMMLTPQLGFEGRIQGALLQLLPVITRAVPPQRVTTAMRRFSQLTEASPVGVAEVSSDGSCSYANRSFLSMIGGSPSTVYGGGWTRRVHPDDLSALLTTFRASVLSRKPFTVEWRFLTPTHQVVPVRARFDPIVEEDGRAGATFLMVVEEVTLEKRLDEVEKQASAARQLAVEARGQLFANISHELRTPVAGILGLAELLLHGTSSADESRQIIRTIAESATGLREVLGELLQTASADQGARPVGYSVVNLREAIERCALLHQGAARAVRKQLSAQIDDSVPTWVIVPAMRLQRVIDTAVSRALRDCRYDTVSLFVDLLESSGMVVRIRFRVLPVGEPVVPEPIQRLPMLDVAAVADSLDPEVAFGVASYMVEQMGGTVLDPEAGGEAGFSWTISCERLDGPGLVPGESAAYERFRTSAPRILVAEDNSVTRYVARRQLESFGCEVVCVNNGSDAVERARESLFDLILMDCQMPVMDGYLAAAAIRADEQARDGAPIHVPIIALTAHVLDDGWHRCRAAGMDEYLPKPWTVAELRGLIRRIVGLPRLPEIGVRADSVAKPGASIAAA
jgi:PAS domain S-box-containing protein